MDCLLAKCIPVVTDCVMAELEKLGVKYRVALRVAKDPRFERLTCTHAGTYADDCIVNRIREHRCYVRPAPPHPQSPRRAVPLHHAAKIPD
ncbi:rRNA-processing protein Fcf1/Utp23 [Perkinsus sp. BL_2016]|nr:rRNA-processing protein Fcf1/Utp23 [Perkinsus sp. BL_2016]